MPMAALTAPSVIIDARQFPVLGEFNQKQLIDDAGT